jgi:hypothetical protein
LLITFSTVLCKASVEAESHLMQLHEGIKAVYAIKGESLEILLNGA